MLQLFPLKQTCQPRCCMRYVILASLCVMIYFYMRLFHSSDPSHRLRFHLFNPNDSTSSSEAELHFQSKESPRGFKTLSPVQNRSQNYPNQGEGGKSSNVGQSFQKKQVVGPKVNKSMTSQTVRPEAKKSQTAQSVRSGATSLPKPKKLHLPSDWPQFFVPRSQQQFSLEYPYLYKANRTCRTPVDIMVVVLSLPKNHLERQAIRDTWGSVVKTRTWPGPTPQTLPRSLGLIFLMGEEEKPNPKVSEAVRQESEKYGDVVQWKGLHDVYFNLTLKVLMGLKWVTEFCPRVSHVIKTDDDTFVHVPRLLQRLLSKNSTKLIWGAYFSSNGCFRRGKYKVSKEAYPFDIYPPHVKGNLYVLPGDAVARMVASAPYLPYNNMEDVHVTGTLARTLALSHQPFTSQEYSTYPKSPKPCLFESSRVVLASQMVFPKIALDIWTKLTDPKLCGKKN